MRNCFFIEESRSIADLTNPSEMVPGTMTITRIKVSYEHRGEGYGSRLLAMILEEADRDGVDLSLEISPSGGLSYAELEAWYLRHGFKESRTYMGIYIRKAGGSETS